MYMKSWGNLPLKNGANTIINPSKYRGVYCKRLYDLVGYYGYGRLNISDIVNHTFKDV